MDEYDVRSNEDTSKTKMELSLEVVGDFASMDSAKSLRQIVFLNKRDLLAKKLAEQGYASFKKAFPDFSGEEDTEENAVQHIKSVIEKKFRDIGRPEVEIFITCALDTTLMSTIFKKAAEALLESRDSRKR